MLLVDDHDGIREAVRTLLASYEDVDVVGEARDGEEAIIRVASCQPEIILMDVNMPRMDGIQATAIIKKSSKDMAIIGLCMVNDTDVVEALLKAGAFAVVSKERLDELYSTIHRACPHRNQPPRGPVVPNYTEDSTDAGQDQDGGITNERWD